MINRLVVLLFLFMVSLVGCQFFDATESPSKHVGDNNLSTDQLAKNPSEQSTETSDELQEKISEIDLESQSTLDPDEFVDLPFDERLIAQGYSLFSLPKDFPLQLPYHFVPVIAEGFNSESSNFMGRFCYDLPLPFEKIVQAIEHLNELDIREVSAPHGALNQLTFNQTIDDIELTGSFNFYKDNYENACVALAVLSNDAPLFAGYKNLPTIDESLNYVTESRTRQLIDDYDYDPDFWEYIERASDTPGMGVDSDDTQSIVEKIESRVYDMTHLSHIAPRIFPYEWYLMRREDGHTEENWSGTFCTDTSISEAIKKHHQLLESHNADVIDYMTNGSPKMNQKSNVKYAFNDSSGEGSWHGRTIFFIDRLNYYQIHKCMLVSLEYSPVNIN